MGSDHLFSEKKSLPHMYLTASYQNSPGMIAGSREEVNEGSQSRKKETIQPISQKLETLLCRLLAAAGGLYVVL